jgi:predicted metalloprotease with PDZ domain
MKRSPIFKTFTILALVFVALLSAKLYSQDEFSSVNQYLYRINLNNATGDHRIYVELEAPQIKEESVEYHFPKMVPGTYAIYNFGRFISDLKAFDANSNILSVEKLDTNRWKISGANKLRKLSFWVTDTYHSDDKPVVFEPVGLCIDSGKVFVMNNYCLFGYFDGYKELPFTVSVTKPAGFYGATSLPVVSISDDNDVYRSKNYFELHDNPILYTVPDTASTMVGNTKVLLSIYSPNKKANSQYLITHTKELFEAQGKYLGGTLPADKYSILVYMYTGASKSGNAGALEHFTSTTFCYPELGSEAFVNPFKDIVAHEFFHIVTPLGIHSKEIHDFDFINPKMSKHLWLYEGSTEYYAHHAQVKYGVITLEEFLKEMQQKMLVSASYFNDTLPFTEMSKGALDVHKSQYINVYLKGALINMCLDLELLKLSGGKYGLQDLKRDLGNKYGRDKPFDDDELFDEITAMTYPSIREFFRKYVEGPQRLPYGEFLKYAGFDYFEKYERESPAMVGSEIDGTSSGQFQIVKVNEFGKKLKIKQGDIIYSVNGVEITFGNFRNFVDKFNDTVKAGDEVTVVVLRKDKDGNLKKKTLKAETYLVKFTDRYVIKPMKNPTAEQLEIRRAWLNQ